jgi:hypothetical protein
VEFVVDKVAFGQVFSEYLGFPCQNSLHRLLHSHHRSSGDGTIGKLVADVPYPKETKKKYTYTAGLAIGDFVTPDLIIQNKFSVETDEY